MPTSLLRTTRGKPVAREKKNAARIPRLQTVHQFSRCAAILGSDRSHKGLQVKVCASERSNMCWAFARRTGRMRAMRVAGLGVPKTEQVLSPKPVYLNSSRPSRSKTFTGVVGRLVVRAAASSPHDVVCRSLNRGQAKSHSIDGDDEPSYRGWLFQRTETAAHVYVICSRCFLFQICPRLS